MRLMLIGTDRNLFVADSDVRRRIARFGEQYTEELNSIVFSTRAHNVSSSQQLAEHVHAHPTNSRSRLLYGLDALKVAKTLPKPDIISAQDTFETGLVALLIARHFSVPFAVEVHTDFISPAFARHSLLNRIRVWIARFVLARAAGGYAVSQKVRDGIKEQYPKAPPLEVFPIQVNVDRFKALPREPQKGNLLWVGRFEREKDPLLALRALKHARAAGHDVRLTLLGSGRLESALRKFVEDNTLGSFVSFPGWRDPAGYLSRTELVLATSQYEGYGLSIVEALAAGVPVLSTDVGVAREAGAVIAEGAYVVALNTWLEGSRSRGVLELQSYANEEEYFSRVAAYYRSLATA